MKEKSLAEEFRAIEARGPDPLHIHILNKHKLPPHGRQNHHTFVPRGKSNKLGEINDDARKELHL